MLPRRTPRPKRASRGRLAPLHARAGSGDASPRAEGVAEREGIGKLAGKGKPSTIGDPGGKNNTPQGVGKPEDVGSKPEAERRVKDGKGNVTNGRGQQKVTLCHRGKKKITVGAPAKEARLNRGDSSGACV